MNVFSWAFGTFLTASGFGGFVGIWAAGGSYLQRRDSRASEVFGRGGHLFLRHLCGGLRSRRVWREGGGIGVEVSVVKGSGGRNRYGGIGWRNRSGGVEFGGVSSGQVRARLYLVLRSGIVWRMSFFLLMFSQEFG